MIKLTGFADEAGETLAEQIRAHQALGWDSIEMRQVKVGGVGKNFTEHDDAAYRQLREELAGAKMGVSCFGSAIANWARKITNPFQKDVDDLKRAAPRMRELGTKYIRIMSYPNDGLAPADWFKEVVRRLKELSKIAEAEGVILAHENCSGYGGETPEMFGELLAAIDSPAFKIAFDTGNPVGHGECVEGQTWAFYRLARPRIAHVHIKDAQPGPDGKPQFCYPGEGRGEVRKVVQDLVKTGYDGYLSIEPHLKSIIHLNQASGSANAAFECYLEYGRRMGKILEEALAAGAKPAGKKARKKS